MDNGEEEDVGLGGVEDVGELMGVALGAYWSGSWVGETEEE